MELTSSLARARMPSETLGKGVITHLPIDGVTYTGTRMVLRMRPSPVVFGTIQLRTECRGGGESAE